ncbi:zinc finger protein 552 [Anabrus simplex]|uniref:zinc finger protein 552 n=1 Tax=Anabrus simplex TaxID=316456 RepID=UPI0034DD76A4
MLIFKTDPNTEEKKRIEMQEVDNSATGSSDTQEVNSNGCHDSSDNLEDQNSNDDSDCDEELWYPVKVELIECEHELNACGGDVDSWKQEDSRVELNADSLVKGYIDVAHSIQERKYLENIEKKKWYPCNVCLKMFSERSNLAAHYRIHTGIKPYQCEVCQRRFTERNTLKRHQATHSTERPYQCEMCDRTYTHVNSLNIHRKFHTSLRNYKCDQCDRSFSTHYNLTTHYRIHTGDRPYECVVCNKSFTQISTLRRHENTHMHSQMLASRILVNNM